MGAVIVRSTVYGIRESIGAAIPRAVTSGIHKPVVILAAPPVHLERHSVQHPPAVVRLPPPLTHAGHARSTRRRRGSGATGEKETTMTDTTRGERIETWHAVREEERVSLTGLRSVAQRPFPEIR